MTILWHFYWPVFSAAILLGLISGLVAFRRPTRRDRYMPLGAGVTAALLAAVAWHGPVGTGDALAMSVERSARVALDNYEMGRVSAKLERGPLTRTLVLHGPADDFQQRQLLRILNQVPGTGRVRWDRPLEPYRGL
jgi:hypothetical protein